MKRKDLETSNLNVSDDTTRCRSGMIDVTTTITTHATFATPPTISLPLSSYTSTPPLISPMDNVDVLRMVVSFIGYKHYRFIAVISQSFHAAYVQEFPNDTETRLDASTEEYAKICWKELKHPISFRLQCRLSSSASAFGSLPAMQYLRSIGCQWNDKTCTYAAMNGHLNVLQYAHENGCPWNAETCAYAAKNGHFNVLKYAHENGCPWDKSTCNEAAKNAMKQQKTVT